MNDDIIRIAKRDTARGEDGYKTFSVRIKEDTVAALRRSSAQKQPFPQ